MTLFSKGFCYSRAITGQKIEKRGKGNRRKGRGIERKKEDREIKD